MLDGQSECFEFVWMRIISRYIYLYKLSEQLKKYQMAIDPKAISNSGYQINQSEKLAQIISDGLGKVYEGGIKVQRPSKILFRGDQTKQILRSAVSGSVKQKINLENTKLKINIDNLSSMISIHQNNEAKFKQELERYRQKIAKYKQKIKQKDAIIAKLLNKLQRKIQVESGTFQNLLIKMHQQNLKGFKNKLGKGQNIQVKQVLSKYQQLLKGFNQHQKQRKYLQLQKQDLQKTVQELKQTVRYVSEKQNIKPETVQIQLLKNRLKQTEEVLLKQKLARDQLLSTLKSSHVQILPQLRAKILQIQKERSFLEKSYEGNQANERLGGSEQIFNLKQKLAQSQINLFRQRESRKGTQKNNKILQQQISNLSKKIQISNKTLDYIQKDLVNIKQKYEKEINGLPQKIELLVQESADLDKYKSYIEQVSKKFSETVKNFSQETLKWSLLENEYVKKLEQHKKIKRNLQDQLQKEVRRMRLFELKLISYDQNAQMGKILQQNPDGKQIYLEQRVQILRNQSLKNKKQNDALNLEATRRRRAFAIIENQLKYAQQRIFQLQQALRQRNVEIDDIQNKKIPHDRDQSLEKSINDTFSEEQIKENIIKELVYLNKDQIQQKMIALNLHINFLENQLNELRNRNIESQLNYEQVLKQLEVKEKQNNQIRKKQAQNPHEKPYSGHILQEGQQLVQSSKKGDYNINLIEINDIPPAIQEMNFQQLARKYESAHQQIAYLKQKLDQVLKVKTNNPNTVQNTVQNTQRTNSVREQILSEQQNDGQQSNSVDIDEDTYKNINQQMDRLLLKNRSLQDQIQQLKRELNTRVQSEYSINRELKQKLKAAEQVNTNLSNIVVHLQSELSRFQNNLDNSMQEQRGSEIIQGSSKKDQYLYNNQIKRQIEQKKKQFEQMLKSQSTIKDEKIQNYQTKLKNLELEIRELQQQERRRSQVSEYKQKPKDKTDIISDPECPNCLALTKINGDLIRKINKNEEQKKFKVSTAQRELQNIQKQHQFVNRQFVPSQLAKQNKKLKQLLSQLKIHINFQNQEKEVQQNQINNLREINQQLVASIHEKQKMLLKLRTQMYRQDYEREGADEESLRKIDDIVLSYEKKIEQLENAIKNQQKSQVKLSDLYDTINYLNNQCEIMRKNYKSLQENIGNLMPQKQGEAIKLQDISIQVPQTTQQLTQKYKELVKQNMDIKKIVSQYKYDGIKQMLDSLSEQKEKNIELMRQNNKLQNKIYEINVKNQEYFKKINQGNIYDIIQDKQKQIQEINTKNQDLAKEIEYLKNDKQRMFIENEKISKDLKQIQQQIQKLSGNKQFSFAETTTDKSSILKSQQRTTNMDSDIKFPENNQFTLVPNKPKDLTYEQSHIILQNIKRKIQIVKNSIQNSSQKVRPSFQIQQFKEIPNLEDAIVMLLDRLHFVWNLVEERTAQYNQLRDQMNIISMECMKSGQFQLQKSRSSENKMRQADIIEQRYEQVLAQLIQYQNQNKRLERQVNRLKLQISQYKKEIEEVQNRYNNFSEMKSQSSEDVPYNKQVLNKLLQSGSISATPPQRQVPEIIKLFLTRIKELEGNLQNIQMQFDDKNKKLQNLIQKQKSFISQKSRLQNQSQQSLGQLNQIQPNFQKQIRTQRQKINQNLMNIHPLVVEQKSYSVNSVRLFRQIQQLTKNNEYLRQKKNQYKGTLENVLKVLENITTKGLEAQVKQQLEKIINSLSNQFDDDSKKDNSEFDLDGDLILSSSFAQKNKASANLQAPLGQSLQEIKQTLQEPKIQQINEKAKKKQMEFSKKLQTNMKLLDENKFMIEELIQKANKISTQPINIQQIKQRLASKFTEKELQTVLYEMEPDQAVNKILETIAQGEKKVNFEVPMIASKETIVQGEQEQIQEGEWVETEQLQAIINQIYPSKSDLCVIVANSINMLMMAETKQGILKAVEFLFSNLKRKQSELKQDIKRRDQSVAQYGKKLQKLLILRYSQEDSQQRSSFLNENSLKKTVQFKSEYEIKKEEQQDKDLSRSQSYSQNYSTLGDK